MKDDSTIDDMRESTIRRIIGPTILLGFGTYSYFEDPGAFQVKPRPTSAISSSISLTIMPISVMYFSTKAWEKYLFIKVSTLLWVMGIPEAVKAVTARITMIFASMLYIESSNSIGSSLIVRSRFLRRNSASILPAKSIPHVMVL